jgi:hypothetical protein
MPKTLLDTADDLTFSFSAAYISEANLHRRWLDPVGTLFMVKVDPTQNCTAANKAEALF